MRTIQDWLFYSLVALLAAGLAVYAVAIGCVRVRMTEPRSLEMRTVKALDGITDACSRQIGILAKTPQSQGRKDVLEDIAMITRCVMEIRVQLDDAIEHQYLPPEVRALLRKHLVDLESMSANGHGEWLGPIKTAIDEFGKVVR